MKQPILIEDLGMIFPRETSKRKVRYGIYKCYCGNEFKAMQGEIKRCNIVSCGCYGRQKVKEANTTHGLRTHSLYSTWSSIIQRCTNNKNKQFNYYGGRGITVCEEWKNDFKNFYDWSISNGYTDRLSIDRIDNDGNYEPNNCRWTTNEVQHRNTRDIMATNTSGYRGVYYNKKSKRFHSQICINYKIIFLGSFIEAIDAGKAYNRYVIDNNLEHTLNNISEVLA